MKDTFGGDTKIIVNIITPIFKVIRYEDANPPNLGEVYGWIDTKLYQMKVAWHTDPQVVIIQEVYSANHSS